MWKSFNVPTPSLPNVEWNQDKLIPGSPPTMAQPNSKISADTKKIADPNTDEEDMGYLTPVLKLSDTARAYTGTRKLKTQCDLQSVA